MSELDEAWAAALSEAERKARLAGRGDVAEYLSLKNSNDLLRKAGVDWLLAEFTLLAGDANRAGASIQIARQEGHRFPTGTSTMVGHLLTLTSGVHFVCRSRIAQDAARWHRSWWRTRGGEHPSPRNQDCERGVVVSEVSHRRARVEINRKELSPPRSPHPSPPRYPHR